MADIDVWIFAGDAMKEKNVQTNVRSFEGYPFLTRMPALLPPWQRKQKHKPMTGEHLELFKEIQDKLDQAVLQGKFVILVIPPLVWPWHLKAIERFD